MEIWILITIAAAFVQNIRSSLQKHLRGQMGTAGVTFVRFGFGVPFAFIFLAIAITATGTEVPVLHGVFFGWIIVAALAQIFGQVLLIMLFAMRNFAVGSAYIRVEPVLAAAFGFALLLETPTLPLIIAVAVSVLGVLLITMAHVKAGIWSLATAVTKREAQIGLASAAMFGLAAVSFRGASLSLGGPNFLVQGGVTLCVAITLQALIMALWIAIKDPADFKRIAVKWKTSAMVGFVGALASFGWYTAMTLEQAAAVKAVAQIEMLFAFATSYFVFKEQMNRREITGCLLIVCGVLVLALTR
ncbi:EamA family transporter [Ahrensia sp. 13_GOM-1096m]|uniref:EamA family transporter n=1 Tax=Ahrensia sp. 13_GOM-1096m TaxID=1380380 RepID=UPI00047E6E83|nr:EamA family transporter [Ahrensia sp. 13_GOM-1096m]